MRRPLSALTLGALAGAALLLPSCKGEFASNGASAGGGQAQLSYSGPGGNAASGRTDRPPLLIYVEDQHLQATRELELADGAGQLFKYREVLTADGQGQVRLDLTGAWDPVAQSWSLPDPLLETLYAPRTFFLLRHRDLHLGHPHGLYSNYEWIPQPGAVQVAGRDCLRMRARSLRGTGDVEFVYESATGLLLAWTMWDETGAHVTARLTTTSMVERPDLTGVQWARDVVPEEPYEAARHDARLGMTPRATSAPPAGFYVASRTFVDTGRLLATVPNLYVEEWTDGVRSLFLAQYKTPLPPPNSPAGLHTVLRSQEGGIRVAEADLEGIHAFALGHLPTDSLDLAIAGLLP